MAKAACWTITDAEARKRGEQTGLDTREADGIQEVSGSIPLISTKNLDFFGNQGFFLLLWLVELDFLRFSPRGKYRPVRLILDKIL